MDASLDLLSVGVGAGITLIAAYAAIRYERAMAQRDVMERLALRLASLAVRLRRAVLAQYAKTSSDPWIPAATEEQAAILSDLDGAMPELERLGGATVRYALAARESLWSNIVWLRRQQTGYRGANHLPDQIGPTQATHHDLWGASILIGRAMNDLTDRAARRSARSLGPDLMRLREEARSTLLSGTETLQTLTEEGRETWVRSGRGI